jgi:hypothetical protein
MAVVAALAASFQPRKAVTTTGSRSGGLGAVMERISLMYR